MPTMSDRRTVALNAVVKGVFQGQVHEYIQQPSLVRVYATGAAVGLNMSVSNGQDVIVVDQEVSAANRMPVRPDDLFTEFGALPGDRIVIDWRNTTGGPIVGFVVVDIIPA